MKKFWIIFFVCIGNIFNTFSQGRTNIWMCGYASWGGLPFGTTEINFTTGIPVVFYNPRKINFDKTVGIISNSNGNLLFYSNGIYISNVLDDTIQNGSGLNPSALVNSWINDGLPLSQGNLILPDLSDTNIYYLFHETAYYQSNTGTFQPHELFYSIIDMSLDSGRGAVTVKNNAFLFDTLIYGELTAVKHANGRDYWLFVHKAFSDKFYRMLFTPYGIINYPDQNIGNIYYAGGAGQCVFSPDGNWYARYMPYDGLTIMQFDRCTGLFSNPLFLQINDSAFAGGTVFSPDSRKLYVSSTFFLYQFDLDSTNILSSMQTVAVWDTFFSPNPPFATQFYLGMLANDGKIYLNCPNGVQHMHIIDSPDSAGTTCNVIQHGLPLPTYNAFTIPNFPNYNLGPVIGSVCDSLGLGVNETTEHNFKLTVFPNPVADNVLSIQYALPKNKSGTLEIYNVTGKKILAQTLPQWSTFQKIKLPELSDGIYLARIKSSLYNSSKKFIVQK